MSRALHILMLEDRPDDAELVVHALRREGIAFDWQRVETEADFVEHLDASLDLILADYSLPQFDALRALHRLQQSGLDIPFIVITGSIEEAAIECMKQGAADYLLKDRLGRLGEAIRHALHEKELRASKRRADESVRASEIRYRRLFEAAKDGILILDAETGQILDANPVLVEMLGRSATEIQGKKLWTISPFRNTPINKATFMELKQTGYAHYDNLSLKTGDSKSITVDFIASVYEVDHKTVIQCNIRDVSERKRMEQAIYLMSDTQRQIAHLDDLLGIYQLVGQKIQEIIGSGYVGISMLDEQIQAMRIVGIYGLGKLYDSLTRRFKVDPSKMVYPMEDMSAEELRIYRSGRLERFEGGLYSVLVRKVPKPICEAIERELKIEGTYTMGFVWQNIHFGGLTLCTTGDISPYRAMIETIMSQAAIAIKRIRSEHALRQSEATLKKAQQVAHLGNWTWHIKTGHLEWSDEMHTIFGVERGAFSGNLSQAIGQAIHPDDRAAVEASNLSVIKDGKPLPLEYRVIWPDGTVRIVWAEAGDLILDEAGEPAILTGIVQDITERKQAEEALHQSEALFHSLVDSLPQNVFAKDLEGHFTFANQHYCATEGKTLADILGKTDFDLHPSELADKYRKDDVHVMESGQVIDIVEEHQPLGGDKFYVHVIKAPLYDGKGSVAGLLGIFWDITERKRAENALLASEERFRKLFELSPDAIIVIDPHDEGQSWPIINCNESACQMNGYSRSELIGQSIDILHEQAEIPADRHDYLQRLRLAGTFKGETLHRHKDGSLFPIMYSTSVITLGDRELVLGIDRDITEQKQAKDALEQRARQLLLLNNISKSVARVIGLDELLDTTARLVHESFGYEHVGIFLADKQQKESLIMKAKAGIYADRFPPDYRLRLGQGMIGWVALYGRRLLANDVGQEMRYQDPFDDGMIQAELSVPIRSEQGNVGVIDVQSRQKDAFTDNDMMVMETLSDVVASAIHNTKLYQELESYSGTLAQAVEERTAELNRVKEHVEAILNYSPDGILFLNAKGMIETANHAFYEMYNRGLDDIYNTPLAQLYDVQQAGSVNSALEEVLRMGRARRMSLIARRQDGTVFDADMALAPVVDDGEVSGVVCSIRDISALKEVERMKDAFVSNVSHELRTPIASLKLNHKLAEVDPARHQVYLARIKRETDRLNALIEDLLRLSRLEQGRVMLDIAAFDLNDLTAQYVSDRTPLANDRQLTLVLDMQPDIPVLRADRGLIGQVLSILLTNAFNYTPAGGRVVVRTMQHLVEGRQWVGFSVSDTGPGVPDDEIPHLFERFFRGQTGRDSGAPGTGLGLAIAKEIVERHSGTIELSEQPDNGMGATFNVRLPMEEQ